MKGLVNQAGGLRNFFGDGSDGAFDPSAILAAATAPNGGTVARLWDMNAGTSFVTGSLTSASDCEILRIDFGTPQAITAVLGAGFYSYQTAISTGAGRNLNVEYSNDGSTWTLYQSAASNVTTIPTNLSWSAATNPIIARYFRWILRAGGVTCTLTMKGVAINMMATDTQTTKVWNVIYPSALNGPAVIKQFSSLTLPAGYSMTVENPCQGLIIYCQGNAVINGAIDMSKKAGLAPNGDIIPMPITRKAKKTAKTSSLLHFNNNVTDDNGRVWTANGSPTYDTTNKKFGTHAISFNGTNQWIDTPASDDFSFGQDDFTIDFWMRPTVVGAQKEIFGTMDATTTKGAAVYGYITTSNRVNVVLTGGFGSPTVSSISSVSLNTWMHVALVVSDRQTYLYINGVREAVLQIPNPLYPCSYKFSIGRWGEYAYPTEYFSGQIDEFRIVKGKAMYTANFTPPTAEYTYTATYTDEPKTMEKYLQLTSVLQPLRGGYGGNGGYGGGNAGSYRSSGGIGGAGRLNLGGFGGGGGGGSSSAYKMGDGGSITYAEIGGSRGLQITSTAAGAISQAYLPGAGGPGDNACRSGDCNGAGGGGGGNGDSGSLVTNGDYSGGFLSIIVAGSITITSGTLAANGGNGGNGGIGGGNGYLNGAGGGGGGGGGGGVIALYYQQTLTNTGTIQVNAGTGGSGGVRAGTTYENGGAGSSGGLGTIHLQQVA